MIVGSQNIGDWSEFYVLLYLLGNGNLDCADVNLNKTNISLPINKIFRFEKGTQSNIDFVFDKTSQVRKIEIYLNNELKKTMESADFLNEAAKLLPDIKALKSANKIPHGEKFLNSLYCERLTESNQISDIRMEVHDIITGSDNKVGFSIKSYIGSSPTLFNASGSTNFIYKLDKPISDSDIERINNINTRTKMIDRVQEITKLGKLQYIKTNSKTFADNLLMIDTYMDKILAEMILYYYRDNISHCLQLIEKIEDNDPLKFNRSGIYEYKFKEFLSAKALGMNPATLWEGVDSANGGYIVAKDNGEVLAFYLYDRTQFKQYLLNSTSFEKADSKKHQFGFLYKENNDVLIKLNLQIRFHK